MASRVLMLLGALTCLGLGIGRAQGTVTASAIQPEVTAAPRSTANLAFRLQNMGNDPVTFTPQVTLPRGWSVLIPPGEVSLAAGETRVVVFSVVVAATAEARRYSFPVTFHLTRDGPLHEVYFAVRVPEINRVALTRLDAPDYVTSGRFTTRFLLRNESNVRHRFTLDAHSSDSLPLVIEPPDVVLGPGEAVEVRVHVTVPENLPSSRSHVLTLQAEHPELQDVRASAQSTSQLVSRTPSRATAYHAFPLTARLSLAVRHTDTTSVTAPTVELYGSGTLNDRDPGRLNIVLETALADPLAPKKLLVGYHGAGGRFAVGHQSFVRSKFLSDESGFGARAERRWQLGEDWAITGNAGAYSATAGPAVTAAARVHHKSGGSGSATMHLSSEGLVTTLEAGYRTTATDPAAFRLDMLRASVAVRTIPPQAIAGHAWELHAGVRQGRSDAQLHYEARTPEFSDAHRYQTNLSLLANLNLSDSFGGEETLPVDLHLAYEEDRSWPTVRADDVRQERLVRTIGATLTTRLDGATLSLGHSVATTHGADTDEREATTRAQSYLPLGEGASLGQELAWIRHRSQRDADQLAYEATGSFATGGVGTLNVGLDVGLLPSTRQLNRLAFAARWAGTLPDALTLAAETEVDLLGANDLVNVKLHGRKQFRNDHELDVQFQATIREERTPAVSVEMGYAVPFSIPLGARSDIGAVRGSVRSGEGTPLEGVIVSVAGSTAVTSHDGDFVLPAVPQGRHLLHLVPSTIPVENPAIDPSSPAVIEVRPGETVELNFEIVPGSTVTGRLVPTAPSSVGDDRMAVGPSSEAQRWLQGATAELTNGTTTLRATTNSQGVFTLVRVPPGTWTLRLRHPNLPRDYRIEPTETILRLEEGDRARAEFELIPVIRTIRFQEGGQVGGGETD